MELAGGRDLLGASTSGRVAEAHSAAGRGYTTRAAWAQPRQPVVTHRRRRRAAGGALWCAAGSGVNGSVGGGAANGVHHAQGLAGVDTIELPQPEQAQVWTKFVAETLLPTKQGKFRLRGYRHTVRCRRARPSLPAAACAASSAEGHCVHVVWACCKVMQV